MTAVTREELLHVQLTDRFGRVSSGLLGGAKRVRFTAEADGTLRMVELARFTVEVPMTVRRIEVGGVLVSRSDGTQAWAPLLREIYQRQGWYTLRKLELSPTAVTLGGGRHRPPADTFSRDREAAQALAERFFPRSWSRTRREQLQGQLVALIAGVRDEERQR